MLSYDEFIQLYNQASKEVQATVWQTLEEGQPPHERQQEDSDTSYTLT